MTERLLQFIWQFQYFNKGDLVTATGEPVQIIHPGLLNSDQGPDFLNARIVIGAATWAGTVELHLKTSDWNKHGHQQDRNYANVILHVVWENDGSRNSVPAEENLDLIPIEKRSKVPLSVPVLELNDRVAKVLLQRYEELMLSKSFIPCEKNIADIRDITWQSWKERLLAERLMRKAALAETFLRQNNYHWEETFWWLLARNFGMKVNAEAFESIARSISLNVLAKHKNQIHQLEALLLGQAGLLEKEFVSTGPASENDYPILLQKEYRFLQKKYLLRPIQIPLYSLRMRPENFPSVRLAELAMLVHESAHLFSKIKESASAKEIKRYFEVTANDYWHYHYQFTETSAFKQKKVGAAMADNIIINTVAPLLFMYGSYHNENRYKYKAIQCLEEIPSEKNLITKGFKELNIETKNARDSQALIELKNEYCNKKRCLECSIGNAVLRN